jgi:hypothetical protein
MVTAIASGFFWAAAVIIAACACGFVTVGDWYLSATLKSRAACCAPFITSPQNGSPARPWVTIVTVIREPTAEFAGVVPDVPWLEHAASDPNISSAAGAASLFGLMTLPLTGKTRLMASATMNLRFSRKPDLSIPVGLWRPDASGAILVA